MIACIFVAAFVAFISAYLAPLLQREMNEAVAKVRTDVVANIVRPGAFTSVERGLIFHIRDRISENQFRGIFIDNSRNREERTTIVAEYGQIVQRKEGTFLVMRDGNVERRRPKERDPTIVVFDQYAFDLTRLAPAPQVSDRAARKILWELLFPGPTTSRFDEFAGPVPRRVARAADRSALSAGVRRDRIRRARVSPHHPAEPRTCRWWR